MNFWFRRYCIYTPVGDSTLPSAVTDRFTIKMLNSILAEIHTANDAIFVVNSHSRIPAVQCRQRFLEVRFKSRAQTGLTRQITAPTKNGHAPPLYKMNFLSSLVLSCLLLSSLLLSFLSSSVFSPLPVPVFFLCLCLSLSLSPCGVVVVMCCVVLCVVCCVLCVVCCVLCVVCCVLCVVCCVLCVVCCVLCAVCCVLCVVCCVLCVVCCVLCVVCCVLCCVVLCVCVWCVTRFETPCVHSTRLRVYVQNVPVCTGTTRTCFNTCARGAGTNGEVLNVHTETFFHR